MRGTVELASQHDALVTVGIKPTWACPSYGYIERAEPVNTSGLDEHIDAYEVARFREKPHPELAAEFLAAGNFTWNAGMFVWKIPAVRAQLRAHCPELADFVDAVVKRGGIGPLLDERFPHLTALSIDYALMEKAERVLNVEASFAWDDVGSWVSVAKYLAKDDAENSHNCQLTQVDSGENIIFSDQQARIALLGVHDLIVVQTGDAVLIADRHQADAIKKLVAALPPELL
jgi:mannose-1-phosphate guanylyltransferase